MKKLLMTLAAAIGLSAPAFAAAEPAVPTVLQDDATFWFSMKDPDASHVVKDGDAILRWYDVREADVANAKRFHVAADKTYGGANPVVVEKDGFPAIYFNGMGSGSALSLRNNTAPETMTQINTFHVFAIVGHYTTQGVVFGSGTSVGNMFMATVNATVTATYADTSRLWASTMRGKTYVDGIRCDPYLEVPPAGRFHLFDSGSPVSGKFGAFFGQWANKSYWGGDYLAEAIAFTRQLSEAERTAIQDYLMKKWFPNKTRGESVTVAYGHTYELGDGANDIAHRNLTIGGEGTVGKTGAGTAYYRATDATDSAVTLFNGALAVTEGAVDLSTRLPLSVSSGTTVDASVTDGGNLRVTTAGAATGALVKTGAGDVALAKLPEGVKSVTVSQGTLEINRKTTPSSEREDSFAVEIENSGFETYATDSEWTTASTPGQIIMPNSTDTYVNGWRRSANQVWMLNYSVLSSTWKNNYNLAHEPKEGHVVAMLHQNGVLATPVSIPKAGVYELSFDIYGREGGTYLGDYVKCTLGTVTSDIVQFGRGYFYEYGYRRVKLRATVTTPGAYELKIRDINIENRPTIVDNVALRYVPACEDEELAWSVPHGDFEHDSEVTGRDNRTPETESPFGNWVFDNGSDGSVAIVTAATIASDGTVGVEYNSTRDDERGGFRQLLMKSGPCSATVTCTPPAGTYNLRADVGRYYQVKGQLTATVTVGSAAPMELGTFLVGNSLMKAYTWDEPFTVSGSEQVSITFALSRQTGSTSANFGVWLDDVRLVSYYDREYLENGGFETPQKGGANWADGWEKISEPWATKTPMMQVQPYSYLPNIFSSDPVEGKYFLYIQRTGGAARSVTFDRAGSYRLSFYQAFSRRGAEGDPSYRAPTPVRAWLAQNGVTNEIGRTGFYTGTNACQYVWSFDVPAAGTYTFGIQGTRDTNVGENACLDALSIRRVDTRRVTEDLTPPFAGDAAVSVAEGARLRVDFSGVNRIDELRLGGRRVSGTVNVADYPDYLSGRGVFFVKPKGMVLLFR